VRRRLERRIANGGRCMLATVISSSARNTRRGWMGHSDFTDMNGLDIAIGGVQTSALSLPLTVLRLEDAHVVLGGESFVAFSATAPQRQLAGGILPILIDRRTGPDAAL
jgi:hypothetical protein